MDLLILVTDENGDVLYSRILYRDGSDSEGAAKIADVLDNQFGLSTADEELR